MKAENITQIDEFCWEIKENRCPGMRVPGRIYTSSRLIKDVINDNCLKQVMNVATLPGIVKYSLAMPDIHLGYGFPIGGVAATDIDNGGVISPGGIGYDINCGVRAIRTNLKEEDVLPLLDRLIVSLYSKIPAGVGSEGAIRLNDKKIRAVLSKGAKWVEDQGYGNKNDLENTESGGCLQDANPDYLSPRAIKRGLNQSGTLGSGNHFVEIQKVEKIYDQKVASVFGLEQDQIIVMLHTGSRGLGYQVCDDYIRELRNAPLKYGYSLPDRQLVCAPFNSKEGQRYFGAVCATANFAWANRQYIMFLIREVFEHVFCGSAESLGLTLIYDVAHNIAKIENYDIDGKKRRLCVHRKGATRAFSQGNKELPQKYRSTGQPVLIPGDMGTGSYIMVGTSQAVNKTFSTVCHGAGRVLSRSAAKRKYSVSGVISDLERKGIKIMSKGKSTIQEEAPGAYKNIDDVISVVVGAGLASKVARMRPLGVIKG